MTGKADETTARTRPFLRWAGGKSKFVQQIAARLPPLGKTATYYEPFLGAGAVYLAYAPSRARLSDLNPHLVDTFSTVRNHPTEVDRRLRALHARDSEETYYSTRDRFNKGGPACLQAARFIYLNQTSFNGIYRVNRRGQYNVPYGFKATPKIPTKQALQCVSRLLRGATISLANYKEALADATRGDVVYLDPPYPPLNGTSYFTHYTKERFGSDDQVEVAATAAALRARGCIVVVTNADTPLIRDLYSRWQMVEISRPRWITSSTHKHRVVELIITSF